MPGEPKDGHESDSKSPTSLPRAGKRRTALLVGCAVVAAFVSAGLFAYNVVTARRSFQADPTNPEQVALGNRLYTTACASCHGRNLEGQANWRRRLPTGEFPAPPHDESGHTWHHPDEILIRITKAGGGAEAPPGFKSNMPAFGGVLSDAEIWAVLAYIKSRWPEPTRLRQAEVDRRNRGQ